jgi:hypothetical protein
LISFAAAFADRSGPGGPAVRIIYDALRITCDGACAGNPGHLDQSLDRMIARIETG